MDGSPEDVCVKRWVLVATAVAVPAIVLTVFLWPRSVARRFEFHNLAGVRVKVTVYRSMPRTNTLTKDMGASDRWPVDYRFSRDEMSQPHRITVTVTRADGTILDTREYEGKTLYGHLLLIRPDGIHMGTERVKPET